MKNKWTVPIAWICVTIMIVAMTIGDAQVNKYRHLDNCENVE